MVWFKVDDSLASHTKPRAAGLEAMGLWSVAGSWSAAQLQDGRVAGWYVDTWPKGRALAAKLVRADLWHAPGHDCPDCPRIDEGWIFHDWEQANPLAVQIRAERDWNRRRAELHRDKDLVAAIRKRDGDRCRYCGKRVDWRARRGPTAATYDHIVPRGDNSLDNVVVACGPCNMRKGPRTPELAGMELLPPGSLGTQFVSRYNPDTNQNETGTELDKNKTPTRPDRREGGSVVQGGAHESDARDPDPTPDEPPDARCAEHRHSLNPGPCGACAKARRASEAYDADQARKAAEAAVTERRRQAEIRAKAAAKCAMCDDDGRLESGSVCTHDPEQIERNRRHVAELREQLTNRERDAS